MLDVCSLEITKMNAEKLKQETNQFSIDSAMLINQLKKPDIKSNYSNQLIRSMASVAANYVI